MTWVRRRADQRQSHTCTMPDAFSDIGDLWRCDDCGQLWRADYACATCRRVGYTRPHDGQHQPGHIWVHASRWERLRYWRAGRPPRERHYGTGWPGWSVLPKADPATEDER